MSNGRHDDFQLTPLIPERDEVVSRHKSRKTGGPAAGDGGAGELAAPVVRKSGAGWGIALLMLGMAGGLGWFGYQNHQLQQQLQQLEYRMNGLAGDISATGETLSESGSTLQKRLDAAEFEIRKLWDLSNKRNRPNIAANAKRLDALEQQLQQASQALQQARQALSAQLAEQQALDKQQAKQLTALQDTMTTGLGALKQGLEQETKQLQAALAKLRSEVGKERQGQASVREQIGTLSQQLATLEQRLQGLQKQLPDRNLIKQVEDNVQAIRAIDTNRKQLNGNMARALSELNSLQLEVSTLRARVEEGI